MRQQAACRSWTAYAIAWLVPIAYMLHDHHVPLNPTRPPLLCTTALVHSSLPPGWLCFLAYLCTAHSSKP